MAFRRVGKAEAQVKIDNLDILKTQENKQTAKSNHVSLNTIHVYSLWHRDRKTS